MAQITAKTVKEHLARASAYAGKQDTGKSLASACEAIKCIVLSKTIFGRERFEIEVLLRDLLTLLQELPEVAVVVHGKIPYAKGTEKKLYLLLDTIKKKIEADAEAALEKDARDREDRFIDAMGKARMYVDRKEFPAARSILNRVCDEFSDREGILIDAGRMFVDAGLHHDALPFFEKSMEAAPRDGRAFSLAVESYLAIGESAKAERLLKTILKQFGASPGTYLTMARLYVETRKWDKAYDALVSILDKDPENAEAKKLMKTVEPKMSVDGATGGGRNKKSIVIDMPKF